MLTPPSLRRRSSDERCPAQFLRICLPRPAFAPLAPVAAPVLAVLGQVVARLASTALSLLPLLEFHLSRIILLKDE